ncbi:MAG: TlpA family protein disulfide reductase [Desulfarculus sp.]|nr:TlpA family protein disulfide reductase [Desulfarculus sp.]
MKRAILLLALVLGLLTLAAQPALALVKPGKPLPALTLPDAAGQNHDLLALTKDKVALMVYWSVTCPHCQREMPHILSLAKRLEGNPFVLVLINTDGQAMAKVVQGYAAEHRLPPPHIMDVGANDSLPFADAFDIVATPGVLVFDRAGKLAHAQELTVDMDKLQKAIESSF